MASYGIHKSLVYKAGSEITKDMSGGILKDITKASILGMFILPFLYNVGYLSTSLLTFLVNNWLKVPTSTSQKDLYQVLN